MIKLIAIDIDGTLLNSKKQIPQENIEAIKKAKAKGVKVVICTGRPLRSMQHYLHELSLENEGDYAITFNGGLAQKNDTGEIIDKKVMSATDVKYLIQFLAKFDLPVDVLSDAVALQIPSKHGTSLYKEINKYVSFQDITIDDIVEGGIYNKVVSAEPKEFLDSKIAEFPQEIYDKFEIFKSRDELVEMMPKGVNKAYGLEKLTKHLGIKQEETMAIGDEENDFPMIKWAGIGVAMGNAVPEVKTIATYITETNDDAGVAKAIEKYVLGE